MRPKSFVLAIGEQTVEVYPDQEVVMGWNFGCAIILFDFHLVVDKLLEPERRQLVIGVETPEERRTKALMDMGVVVLEALGISTIPADAPVTLDDAIRQDFDDYGVCVSDGKTILVGRRFGLDQDFELLRSAYARVSAEYGDVYAFWCNDASDTYMISTFRKGSRIRFWAMGPGLDENHGERLAFEPERRGHGHDHLMALLEAVAGCPLGNLWNLQMERFA